MLGRIRLCNWVSLTIGCGLEWKDVSLPGAYFVSESLEVLCSGAPQKCTMRCLSLVWPLLSEIRDSQLVS